MSVAIKDCRLFVWASYLAVGAVFITGCGDEEVDTIEETITVEGRTTVTYWHNHTGRGLEAIEQLVADFNASQSDIFVQPIYSASSEGDDQRLLTAIAGGNPPDLAHFDRFKVAQYANENSLESLTPFIEADNYDMGIYYDYAVEETTYEEEIYAMPVTTDSRLLFYNKDRFAEVGLDPEDPPQTIEELEYAIEQLSTIEDGRVEELGMVPWTAQGWLYTWAWAFGGDFYDLETNQLSIDHPKNIEALEWLVSVADEYDAATVTSFDTAQGSNEMDPFIQGIYSMKVDGPFSISTINQYKPDLNYGVTPVPTPTGDDFATWSGGTSIIMPRGAKNQEEAWEFLKYVGSVEGQLTYSDMNSQMSVIAEVNEELYADDPIMTEFIEILPFSNTKPPIPSGQLLWNELDRAVEYAIHGRDDPKTLLEKVARKVEEAEK
ncbi:multiple sugar transport system substrate-binding protein [Alkalihalobacillus xiaoxiensis]|uniref:Multiple sugar transport system substrate-binding protein n=1 Tax=Shouchella xiaoxiensis TaxID=766895 RepID=A0ABS2SXP3_9BACI|nr:ABC transporter substrate-binding protein [Shouchella xiaoxiensis]MBM7840005.1 multiple sugar transport system substrate-binding protein [Shouchella xiaoxiensis]